MHKTTLILLFCLACNALFAQKNHVEFGLELSGGFSGTHFTYEMDAGGVYQFFKDHLALRPAGSATLFARYYLGRRVSLQLGAGYGVYGFRQQKFAVNGVPPTPYYPVASTVALESKSTFTGILFPFDIRYGKAWGRVRWYLLGGLAPLLHLSWRRADKAYYDNGDTQTLEYQDSFGKKFNLLGRLGAGIELPLTQGLSLFVQPTASYGFLNNYHTEMTALRPFFFTLNIGIIR